MTGASTPQAAGPSLRQRTLAGPIEIEGVGLHTGAPSRVVFRPAPAGHGRTFVRVDLPGAPEFSGADMDESPQPGRTALSRGEASVQTVEHVLAALSGMGVDNVRVELTSPEPPVGDGSARLFAEAVAKAGIVEQDAAREAFAIEEPIVVERDGARLVALPMRPRSPEGPLTAVGYSLAYRDSPLARGWVEHLLTAEEFLRGLAPARTFCMARDVERLRALGLGKGATHENTLVIDGDRVVGNELRFSDEPARHKALDLVGDLGLLGAPLVGRVCGFRSGHRLNGEMVREILRAVPRRRIEDLVPGALARRAGRCAAPDVGPTPCVGGEPAMGIADIERILPHRYPFLLVDRVLELEPEKRVVAVKNVSWNEEFFSGHFPESPVMPGVLQVEALAQAAGLLLSKYVRVGGKMAALAGVDRVKLRRPVLPGDRLVLVVELKKVRRSLAICGGVARVGGNVAAEATLIFGLIRDRAAP